MDLRKLLGALFVACGALALAASPVRSDPAGSKNAETLELECDDGSSLTIVVAGGHNLERQIFSPAHDLGSNRNFVPVSFGTFAGAIEDSDGNPVFDFVEEDEVRKGNARVPKNRTPLECTYFVTDSFVAEEDDAEIGLTPGETYTFTGSGEVSGFLTGSPR